MNNNLMRSLAIGTYMFCLVEAVGRASLEVIESYGGHGVNGSKRNQNLSIHPEAVAET